MYIIYAYTSLCMRMRLSHMTTMLKTMYIHFSMPYTPLKPGKVIALRREQFHHFHLHIFSLLCSKQFIFISLCPNGHYPLSRRRKCRVSGIQATNRLHGRTDGRTNLDSSDEKKRRMGFVRRTDGRTNPRIH